MINQYDLMTHRFGVNYVPSQNWYYCYNDWCADVIRRDLDAVAELGADHIRVQLIWPWFQPNPTALSSPHLDHMEELLEVAANRNLDVLLALYTGGLSGYRFDPSFYWNEPFYTSPQWRNAQEFFLEGVAQHAVNHDNFMGFDIGNEINVNWQAALADGDAWMASILKRMNDLCPGRVHVNGVDHKPWFKEDTFSPSALVAAQQIVPIHCWAFWTEAGKYGGPLDDPYTRLLAAMAALVRSFGNTPQKPVWVEEFGVCSEEMPEADLPRWLEKALSAAIDQGVSWFTWWASHDVEKRFQFHPFEYGLGLLNTDNRLKPQGRMFKQFADAWRGKPVKIPASPLPPPPIARHPDATWRWLLDWMNK